MKAFKAISSVMLCALACLPIRAWGDTEIDDFSSSATWTPNSGSQIWNVYHGTSYPQGDTYLTGLPQQLSDAGVNFVRIPFTSSGNANAHIGTEIDSSTTPYGPPAMGQALEFISRVRVGTPLGNTIPSNYPLYPGVVGSPYLYWRHNDSLNSQALQGGAPAMNPPTTPAAGPVSGSNSFGLANPALPASAAPGRRSYILRRNLGW